MRSLLGQVDVACYDASTIAHANLYRTGHPTLEMPTHIVAEPYNGHRLRNVPLDHNVSRSQKAGSKGGYTNRHLL